MEQKKKSLDVINHLQFEEKKLSAFDFTNWKKVVEEEKSLNDITTPLWKYILLKSMFFSFFIFRMPYDQQLIAKAEVIKTAFSQINSVVETPINFNFEKVYPSPTIFEYRNKVDYSVGYDRNNNVCVGFQMGKIKFGVLTTEVIYQRKKKIEKKSIFK